MVRLADGSLIVGTTVPKAGDSPNVAYYNGTGTLMSFSAPGSAGVVVSSPIPGAITGISQLGPTALIVGTTGSTGVPPPGTTLTLASFDMRILLKNGNNWSQSTAIHVDQAQNAVNPAFVVVPTPGGGPNQYDLFFQIGAASYTSQPLSPVSVSGLVNGQFPQGGLYRVALTVNGDTVQAGTVTQIATGIRNSFGMAIDGAGNLYFGDNGAEGDLLVPGSLDTLNLIPGAATANLPLDFGYPSSYVDRDGTQVNFYPGRQTPVAIFDGAHPPSGISNVVVSPSGFPSPFNGGIFFSFHGEYFEANTENGDNPVLYFDPITQTTRTFVAPGQAGVGNLDGLLASGNSLFMTDFQVGPGVFAPGTGAVYEISLTNEAVPESSPGVMVTGGVALLLFGIHWTRRNRIGKSGAV
jgi:hypothetical protein